VETEETRVACVEQLIAFQRFLQPFIEEVRLAPNDKLLSHLVNTPTVDGDRLSDAEIHSLVQTMNAGGTETTTNGLGNMFGIMLHDPALQAELRSNASLIARFVEEAIRLESPVAGQPRWVRHATQLGDVHIPKGSVVQVRIGAANRDAERFGCPAHVDMQRKGIRSHLGFGLGLHYCLGATLARAEMQKAMEHILARTASITLDPDAQLRPRAPRVGVRAWQNLPVRFARAPADLA
jgi:cytochrome P450